MAQHKGKVERAVPVVRKHLLAGRTFADINEANERALTVVQGRDRHGDPRDDEEEAVPYRSLPMKSSI